MAEYTIDKFTYGGNTYNIEDANAMPKSGGTFTGSVTFSDTMNAPEASIGDLVITGAASFTNGIQASQLTGMVPSACLPIYDGTVV